MVLGFRICCKPVEHVSGLGGVNASSVVTYRASSPGDGVGREPLMVEGGWVKLVVKVVGSDWWSCISDCCGRRCSDGESAKVEYTSRTTSWGGRVARRRLPDADSSGEGTSTSSSKGPNWSVEGAVAKAAEDC